MENNNEYVLIIENAGSNLDVAKKNGSIILTGVAAVFGQENNNHRIYEENEYLPHLEYLQEKIRAKRLIGELDHPANFETSLKNASHIVEALEYDKKNRCVNIRIRLIDNHPAGEMAKALVEAGIPVSISSRAAGLVRENKKVQIKKIFTYDIVADPGFAQAQLQPVMESISSQFALTENWHPSILDKLENVSEEFVSENSTKTKIYRINEDNKEFSESIKNKTSDMNDADQKHVTWKDMDEYSKIVKGNTDNLRKDLDKVAEAMKNIPTVSTDNSTIAVLENKIQRMEKYIKYIAENVDKTIQYSEYLAENLDKNIEYSKYLAESLDQTITYSEYLAENVDKTISYSNYLAENLDKSITYANYLAENLDKGISYAEYLAENLDKNISYSEYLAENLDKNISYSEYLAEHVDNGIQYGEYLSECIDKNISYSEYVAEKTEKSIAYTEYIAESINKTGTAVAPVANNEKGVNESVDSKNTGKKDIKSIVPKIDELLESVRNQKTALSLNEARYSFFKFLGEEKKKEFMSLEETKKEKVVDALKNGAYFSEADITKKWDAALVEKKEPEVPKFLKEMPDSVKPLWESLSVTEKQSIVAQASQHKLNTDYQIKHFWKTRNLVKTAKTVGLQRLSETESAASAPVVNKGYANDFVSKVADELSVRFRTSNVQK